MKVIINTCYGGFGLSEKAQELLKIAFDLHDLDGLIMNRDFGVEDDNWYMYRADARLHAVVDLIGLEAASGSSAKLEYREIPDHVVKRGWCIGEYDGLETIHELGWSTS